MAPRQTLLLPALQKGGRRHEWDLLLLLRLDLLLLHHHLFPFLFLLYLLLLLLLLLLLRLVINIECDPRATRGVVVASTNSRPTEIVWKKSGVKTRERRMEARLKETQNGRMKGGKQQPSSLTD